MALFVCYPNGFNNLFDMTVFRAYRDYFFEIDVGNERSMADNTQCTLCSKTSRSDQNGV